MAAFNLTAQLQLQAPTNTQQVVSNIQKGLKGVNVKLNIQADSRALAAANKQLQGVNKSAQSSSRSISTLNRNLSEAARRFSVITVATGTFIALARAMKNSIGAAVAFEREMVKISQVTGTSVGQLHGLSKAVTQLSTGLGVANQSLLETSRILAQAGMSALKTRQALEILAKTTLAPSFDNIIDTTEGAIAILNQFGREATKAGQDIKFLEQSLDAINAVSKRFAVESADLITAIRRTGGVFQAAGGNLKELIALFTSVRQTTRESAETIATGFRTIFTRLQRSETIDALNNLGISLTDLEGKFIGPLKAIERLSIGLAGLDPKDVRFNEIVEQLGGFRQIGKVIPLLKQYVVTQNALSVANNSAGSTAKDAELAQQSLAVQFSKVREQFDALIRKFSDSETFKSLAGTVLKLATSFLKFGEILADVLPQLTALAAIKIGQNLAPGVLSIFGKGGGGRRNMGGRIHGYAKGGWVPGQGSGDTVPAMLQPGEFVIKKSSAKKLGSSTLEAMNNNRFSNGSRVRNVHQQYKDDKESLSPEDERYRLATTKLGRAAGLKGGSDVSLTGAAGIAKSAVMSLTAGDGAVDVGGAFLQPAGVEKMVNVQDDGAGIREAVLNQVKNKFKMSAGQVAEFNKANPMQDYAFNTNIHSGSTSSEFKEQFRSNLNAQLIQAGKDSAPPGLSVDGGKMQQGLDSANIEQLEGGVFESFLAGMANNKLSDAPIKISANDNWDFPSGVGGGLGKFFDIPPGVSTDAKRTFHDESISLIAKKAAADLAATVDDKGTKTLSPGFDIDKIASEMKLERRKKKAKGGSARGSDTVPALLTPGEFVFNKSAAQSIGYSNLANMNKTGIAKFAKGGGVGVQTFAGGGGVLQQSVLSDSDPIADIRAQTELTKKDMAMLGQAAKTNAGAFDNLVSQLQGMDLDAAEAALKSFARNMTATADEAEILDGAMEAAHSQIVQSGPSGSSMAPSKGVAGKSDSRVMPERSGDEMAELTQKADAVAKEFEIMGEQTRAGQKAMLTYKQAILAGKTEAEALTAGMDAGTKHVAELDAEMEDLLKQYAKGAIKEKELNKATEELKKKRKAVPGAPGGPPTPPDGGGGGGGRPRGAAGFSKMAKNADKLGKRLAKTSKGFDRMATGLSKVGSAMSGLATMAIGAMFVMGTLMETVGGLTDQEKEREEAGMAAVSTHLALGAQIISLGATIAAATAMMIAKIAADGPALVSKVATTIANFLEAGASTTAAVADTGEAVATTAVTASLGPLALAIIAVVAVFAILLAAVLVLAAVFAGTFLYSLYKSAKAAKGFEQAVRRFNKIGDDEKDKLSDPTTAGGASESKFVQARQGAAVADFNKTMIEATKYKRAVEESKEATQNFARTMLILSNPVTALGYVIFKGVETIGQAFGYFRPSVNDAIDAIDKYVQENQKYAQRVAKISAAYATGTFRAIKATNDFANSMTQAERNNLDATQKMGMMSTGLTNMLDTFDANEARVKGMDTERAALEEDLIGAGILTPGGEETGEETTGEQKDKLKQLKELDKQRVEYMEANNKLLQESYQKENLIRSNMQESLSGFINQAGKGEGRGAGIDLADPALAGNFDAIIKQNAEVFKAHQDGLASLNQVIDHRYKRLIDTAQARGDDKQVQNLKSQQGLEKALAEKELEKNTLQAAKAVLELERASITGMLASIAVQRTQQRVNATLRGFNNMLLGATKTAALFAKADSAIAIAEGGAPEAALADASILELPFEQIDPGLLNNKIDEALEVMTSGINPLSLDPLDQAVIKRGNDMKDSIMNAGTVIDELPGAMREFMDMRNQGELLDKNEAKLEADKIFANLNATMGGALESAGGVKTELGTLVNSRIQELLQSGETVTFEDVKAIQDEIRELTEEEKATMIRLIEIKNQYIEKLDSVNTAIIDAQQRYAEATAKVIDVQERAADRMAKARGGRGRRDRGVREQGRRRAASQRLGREARGAGAVAGNVAQTAAAMNNLQTQSQVQADTAAAGGSKEEIAAANDAAKRLAQGAGQARKELERLADQSGRASDVMADIQDEQAKRKQLNQLGENLAFGGDDQRKDIAKGFMNLRTALGQGGMQGATEEQRASIKSVLDSLPDVEIGGTGKTGKEIKAQFQSDEILRMTGNQALADASFDQAMAGSAEEVLLQELEAIGQQEIAAAQALAANALTQVGLLTNIRDDIRANFNSDSAQAQRDSEAASSSTGEDLEKMEADLVARLGEVNTAIGQYATEIDTLNSTIKVFKTMLTGLNEAMKHLQEGDRVGAQADKQIIGGTGERDASGKLTAEGEGMQASFERRKGEMKRQTISYDSMEKDDEGNYIRKTVALYKEINGVLSVNKQALKEAKDDAAGDTWKQINTFTEEAGVALNQFGTDVKNQANMLGSEGSAALKGQVQGWGAGEIGEADFGGAETKLDSIIAKADNAAVTAQTATLNAAGITKVDAGGNVTLDGAIINISGQGLSNAEIDAAAEPLARGGMVYAAGGGSIFQPKGTDTVPAMLTPGEFVIKKSAVDKVGMAQLKAINNGSTLYKADGGPVDLPQSGYWTQELTRISQDKKKMRAALTEVYGRKEGMAHFSALLRLSKLGIIGPENVAASSDFEDYFMRLRNAGMGLITDWNAEAPAFKSIDPAVQQNMKNELENIAANNNNTTADSKRVGQESAAILQPFLAQIRKAKEGITATAATAPKQGEGDKGTLLAHKLFAQDGMYDPDDIEARSNTLATMVQTKWGLKATKLGQALNTAKAMQADEGKPFIGPGNARAGKLVEVAEAQQAQAEAAVAAEEQIEGDAKRIEQTKERIGKIKQGRVRDSVENDFQTLGAAGILRMAQGGGVGGQDTVPAMLTPGEFVMNANAVKRHGIGYMKNLNRGRVPGFNKGGLVGRGNVSYLQNGGQPSSGGVLALDASNVQAVLTEFNSTFGMHVDSLITQFSTFNESASVLATAITGGMDVRLNISGDLTTAVKLNGDQADHVKNALADAIVPMVVEQVSDQISIKFDELKNSP
jgi:hypothetical protein